MDDKENKFSAPDDCLEEIIREVRDAKQGDANPTHKKKPAARSAAPAPQSAAPAPREPDDTESNAEPRMGHAGKRIGIAIGATALVLVAMVFGYTYLQGGIYRGVHAGSIDLSGMSVAQATEAIDAERDKLLSDSSIDLRIYETNYAVDVGEVTDGLDSDTTAQMAFDYGRTGNPFSRAGRALGALFGGKELELTVMLKEEALATRLEEISNESLTPPIDPSYTIEGDELVIDTGKNGIDFDRTAVADAVAEKIRRMDFAPYEVEAQAEQQSAVDLVTIQAEITSEAKNAIVDKSDGKSIIPEQNGIVLDLDAATALLGDGSEQTYRIPLTLTPAKILADDLAKVLFSDTLASTSTNLNAGNRSRTNNVRLACENINGTILNPGEEFSYNEVVGERTAARGFKSAGAYSQGRVVDEVGGGVCQPSSTLYMAVLRADLEVTKRSNHSFTVAYTPLGEDATVSWGGPDLKFKNDTDYPVKIVSSQSGSSCNMSIVGTKTSDKTVKMKTNVLSTIGFSVVEKPDASLAAGVTRVDQTGSTGYRTETFKIITENGETRTVQANKSSYNKRDKLILVGLELVEPPVVEPPVTEPPVDGGTTPPVDGGTTPPVDDGAPVDETGRDVNPES